MTKRILPVTAIVVILCSVGCGPGRYSVSVDASGYLPLNLEFEIGEENVAEFVFELTEAGADSALSGAVFDAKSSEPVNSFRVELVSTQVRMTRQFDSKDGLFEWTGLGEGGYSVIVSAAGYAPFVVRDIPLLSKQTTTERFELETGVLLRGQVVDKAARLGVSGARVQVFEPLDLDEKRESGPHAIAVAFTNSLGEFEVGNLPSHQLLIEANADGYRRTGGVLFNGADEVVEIPLSKGVTMHFHVREPVPPGALHGASIEVFPQGRYSLGNLMQANPNQDGQFVVQGVPLGRYNYELAHAFGREVGSFDIEALDVDQFLTIELPDEREFAALVRGQVSGLLPGEVAEVQILPWGPSKVDSQGKYEARAYGIVFRPESDIRLATSRGRLQVQSIALAEGDAKTVNFSLGLENRVRGRVTRRGEPVPGIRVSGLSHGDGRYSSSRTDENGEVSMSDLSEGSYTVFVQGRRTNIELPQDKKFEMDLCAPPAYANHPYLNSEGKLVCDDLAIAGRIEASGRPLAGVSVTLMGIKLPPKFTRTDSRGQFGFRDLLPDEYYVVAHLVGYQPTSARVDVAAKADSQGQTENITVNMLPGESRLLRTRSFGPTPRTLIVEMRGRFGQRLWFPISIDGEGHGYLPLWLADKTFSLRHPSIEILTVSGWAGQELRVDFVACDRHGWEGCLDWPWAVGGMEHWPSFFHKPWRSIYPPES